MTLAIRPSTSLVAAAASSSFPCYVTRPQALAIIAAASSQRHRLLVQTLWESGGRASEVLCLRRADVNREQASLVLDNRKQRDPKRRRKTVYVSRDLAAQLDNFARDLRLRQDDHFFTSLKSSRRRVGRTWVAARPMSRQQCWEIVTELSRLAGVEVLDGDRLRPASPLDFRHGAALDMLRSGTPFPEVGTQLGHSRLDSTLIYTRLVAPERRDFADRRFGA